MRGRRYGASASETRAPSVAGVRIQGVCHRHGPRSGSHDQVDLGLIQRFLSNQCIRHPVKLFDMCMDEPLCPFVIFGNEGSDLRVNQL